MPNNNASDLASPLAGRTALITGGSRGLGFACAQALATYGAHVIVAARNKEAIDAAVQHISAVGGKARGYSLDMSEAGAVEAMYGWLDDQQLHADIVVNSAGMFRHGSIAQSSAAEWHDLSATNVTAALVSCQQAVVAALIAALETIQDDLRMRVVVLRGAGQSFCAGADLDEHFVAEESRPDIGRSGLWERIEQLRVPVIAAVHGWAVTGGFLLAYSCDLIVAAESARFRDTHAALGLLPTGGESQRLPRLIGLGLARELMFTSHALSAAEALQVGLVTRVVPDSDLNDAALYLAEQISASSPRSVRAIKQLINKGARAAFAAGMRLEAELNGNGSANELPDTDREERLQRFRDTGRI